MKISDLTKGDIKQFKSMAGKKQFSNSRKIYNFKVTSIRNNTWANVEFEHNEYGRRHKVRECYMCIGFMDGERDWRYGYLKWEREVRKSGKVKKKNKKR